MFFLGKVASNCDVRTLTCTTKACPGLETFFKKNTSFYDCGDMGCTACSVQLPLLTKLD